MNPYQILQISPSATNDEIISAHRKLNSMAAIALKDKPDLYKLRKYSLESAMNQLLDNSKRTEIDKTSPPNRSKRNAALPTVPSSPSVQFLKRRPTNLNLKTLPGLRVWLAAVGGTAG